MLELNEVREGGDVRPALFIGGAQRLRRSVTASNHTTYQSQERPGRSSTADRDRSRRPRKERGAGAQPGCNPLPRYPPQPGVRPLKKIYPPQPGIRPFRCQQLMCDLPRSSSHQREVRDSDTSEWQPHGSLLCLVTQSTFRGDFYEMQNKLLE